MDEAQRQIDELQAKLQKLEDLRQELGDEITDQKQTALQAQLDALKTGGRLFIWRRTILAFPRTMSYPSGNMSRGWSNKPVNTRRLRDREQRVGGHAPRGGA